MDAEYHYPEIYENLVTPEEAQYIISTAQDLFVDSTVLGDKDKTSRKSKTAWLRYSEDPVAKKVLDRICGLVQHKVEHAETALQVVQYKPGGYYKDHHDSCCEKSSDCTEFMKNGGQRVLTVLVYLNDEFTGGSTRFKNLKKEINPPKYGGIVFRSLEKNGRRCHPLALHGGMPVESGTKYVCNIWIREGPTPK